MLCALTDLIADGPRLASVEIRPEGNSGLRGVKIPTDEHEKKMMVRCARCLTDPNAREPRLGSSVCISPPRRFGVGGKRRR